MSYNGSGTFQINTSGQPVVAGTVISSTAFNALTADLATGLSTAITKDGQTTATARIPFAQGISSTLTTDSSSVSTGSIITAGGVGIAKALYVGTTANVASTTDSSSISTGSIVSAGGVGVAKNLYVGVNANVAGTLGVTGVATFSAAPIYSSLTASSAVATDASKGLVSVTNTGTGNNVLATAPTIASANLTTALTLTGAAGTTGQALTSQGTGVAPIWSTVSSNTVGFKNRIINGGMDLAQRGTSFTSTSSANNDDTYVLDRFYILSDGNDIIDVTQTTTVPTGAKYSIGLDVETVNKKFGIAQIIENANCFDAIGGNVTVSFQAKVSATTNLDNIKCAIVAWSGTADTVTSDIISAWGVEGTNPTLIANATYENTPANLGVTTSFATYSVTANVDTASTSNIILFIWSDVTTTSLGEFLYITNVQLEKGSTATSFDYRPYGTELALCQRYYYKIFPQATASPFGLAWISTTSVALGNTPFPITMRTAPTALEQVGTANNYAVATGGSATVCTSVPSFSTANTQMARTTFTTSAVLVAGQGGEIRTDATNGANAYLAWSAEL